MAASIQLQDEIIRVERIRAEQVAFYSKHPCPEATTDLNIVDNHLLTLRDLLNRSLTSDEAITIPVVNLVRSKDFHKHQLIDSDGILIAHDEAERDFFESHRIPYGWSGEIPAQHQYLRILANIGLHDITPLAGSAVTELYIPTTPIDDLSPLRGLPLTVLDISYSDVTDLSPLKGMPLERLYLFNSKVSDLSPLKGMALTVLDLRGTRVTDISVLADMPLKRLDLQDTAVTDLSVLADMNLTELRTGQSPDLN